jgi:hypothetical protein
MKHLIPLNVFLNEDTDYDHILDVYNAGGTNRMWPTEVDFLKSGGKQGSAFRHLIADELLEIYDKVFETLAAQHIPYKLEESWGGGIGWFRYIDVPYSDNLYQKLESMFSGHPNDTVMPFFQKRDGGRIYIYMIDPDWYKDIIKMGG